MVPTLILNTFSGYIKVTDNLKSISKLLEIISYYPDPDGRFQTDILCIWISVSTLQEMSIKYRVTIQITGYILPNVLTDYVPPNVFIFVNATIDQASLSTNILPAN